MRTLGIRGSLLCATLLLLAFSASSFGGREVTNSAQGGKLQSPRSLSPRELFSRVSPSVMVVESLNAEGKATVLGSGIVIAPGRVVTNRHVVEGGVTYRLEHEGRAWPAKLVRVDADHDLAELAVASLEAPAVRVRNSSSLAVGEEVYAIGAPEGLELTISEGLISGLRDFGNEKVIQTSAAISPGSSGGGLFDAHGRLVGITTFYLQGGQSLNFALPAEWASELDREPTHSASASQEQSPSFQALVWAEAAFKADNDGNYSLAVDEYREAIRLKPDFVEAWANLGDSYGSLGRYRDEVDAEQQAIRLRPDLATVWVKLGHAYGMLGQYDRAVDADKRAVRAGPDDEVAWNNLGHWYGKLGQYGKEVDAEKQAIRVKPDHAAAWYNLGTAEVQLGQNGEAIKALQEAVRLMPTLVPGWYNLGIVLAREGKRAEAMKVYEKMKTLDPKRADRLFNEAKLYLP